FNCSLSLSHDVRTAGKLLVDPLNRHDNQPAKQNAKPQVAQTSFSRPKSNSQTKVYGAHPPCVGFLGRGEQSKVSRRISRFGHIGGAWSLLVCASQRRSFILISQNSMTEATTRKPRKSFTPLGILFADAGVAPFVYFVKKAGVDQILAGVSRLGAGFILIIAISSVRHIVRSIAWMLCVEQPYRLRFWDALRARL